MSGTVSVRKHLLSHVRYSYALARPCPVLCGYHARPCPVLRRGMGLGRGDASAITSLLPVWIIEYMRCAAQLW
eukprot:1104302-Rhodomonas_salina.1